jgi:DNA mismatch endonuclease (patch repair protein)
MADHLTSEKRSRLMGRIRSKGSTPEMIVRRAAHALGYRFRLHRRDLPGTPDLVFPSRRKVVFVHGCWWHQHPGCKKATGSKTQTSFWAAKFARNVARDRYAEAALRNGGWDVLTVWECETRDLDAVSAKLDRYLTAHSSADHGQ